MKIKRYTILVTAIVAFICLMMLIMNEFKGLYIEMFLDLKAFLMVIIIPSLTTLVKYNLTEIITHTQTAFSTKKLNIETYLRAYDFYRYQGLVLIYTGVFILVFSIIVMLRDLSIEHIGKCLGTALCGIIYTVIIIILYILPIRMTLKDKI